MNWITKWLKPKTGKGYQSVILQARQILSRDGAAEALRFLAESPEARSKEVFQTMLSIAYSNQDKLASFWDAFFLDPIFCQCSLCNSNWLIPPQASIPDSIEPQSSAIGVKCRSCDRVLCPNCTKIAGPRCRCGSAYVVIRHPNGRKRADPMSSEPESDPWSQPQIEIALEDSPYVYLYYGSDGRMPVALDSSFPLRRTATIKDHLDWAEALIDAGCYYQAQQQLDLIDVDDAELAKAQWLRAGLELVQYQNAWRRARSHLDYESLPSEWYQAPKQIKQRLEQAVQLDPGLGGAWLLAAQVYSTPECGPDYSRALECALQAETCLGAIPAVLLVKGKVLRELGQPAKAVTVLYRIPSNSAEAESAKKERELAELEAHCQDNPADADSVLRLGRWYIRLGQEDRSQRLFSRLVELRPDRPEGYYGLAKLVFLNSKFNAIDQYNDVYNLCREALRRNPEFGLAYELLGSIFRNLSFDKHEGLNFKIEEPLDYYRRAVELDPTCDIALWLLGEAHINQGELQPAIEMLERAAALDTNASSVYFLLAAIYMGLRQYEKQDWAQRKAKELSPDTELSTDYEQKILKLCSFEY